LLLIPALAEELVFRGLVLPSPIEGVGPLAMVPWVALSVGLFVAWHGLWWRLPSGPGQRQKGRELVRMALLGGGCALAYVASHSIWPPVLLHWLALVRWRLAGGTPAR
jgi:predicted Abi (CAAX) family protease